MSVSKKLAWSQLIMMGVSVIAVIAMVISFMSWEVSIEEPLQPALFAGGWWLLSMGLSIASFVVGIIQCVYAGQSHDASGKALAAGILALLSLIPFVGIAALVLNILVVADSSL